MLDKYSFRFHSTRAAEGVSVHVLPTRKFKTTMMCLLIGRELDERASHAALLGEVLKRGSAKFPDMRVIAEEMEEMYGGSFGCGISRIGGKQVVTMRLALPSESFLPKRAPLLDRGFNFLEEMLLRPLVKGGAFNNEVVKREKVNLQARIFSLINDKMEYAQRRCVEEMCRTERFRFYEYGEIDKVAAITPRGLFDFYGEMLATRPVDVFVVGDVDEERIVRRVSRMFRGRKPGGYAFTAPEPEPKTKRPRKVTEKQEVEQAKLCLGLRTHTNVREPDYPAAVMYNGLLGGFSHSRLFRAVREKAGLAYDAHSYIENSKGLMIVGAGLERKHLSKAMRIIDGQMQELRKGRITRDEMGKTRKAVITRLNSSVDSPLQLMHLHYSQMVNGVTMNLDHWKRKISAVTVGGVKDLAGKVTVDTVYLLLPQETKRER